MGETIRCQNCSAIVQVPDGGKEPDRFCRFCGAAFRAPEPAAPVVVQESRADERERRFAELKRHSSTRRAQGSKPSAAPTIAKHSGGLLILLFVLGIAVVIAGFQSSVANEVERGFDAFGQGMPRGFPTKGPEGFPFPSERPLRSFFGLFKIVPMIVIGVILVLILSLIHI